MSKKPKIDKEYIEKRANGWIKKIEHLYTLITDTLKSEIEIECKTDQSIIMQEEIMQKHGIPPKNVPIFDLFIGNQLKATFKPIGLWVVGARGRIDILTNKGSYILVDLGDDDLHPNWQVFSPKNRKTSEPFNAKFIEQLVH